MRLWKDRKAGSSSDSKADERPGVHLAHSEAALGHVGLMLFLLLTATSFAGVALLPIRIGPVTVFAFRLLLVLQVLLIATSVIRDRSQLRVFSTVRLSVAFLFLWLTYAAFSLAWVHTMGPALRNLGQLMIGVAFVLCVIYYIRNSRQLRWIAWIWLIAFGVLVGIGLWENITGAHLPVSGYFGVERWLFAYRPTGIFNNPNDYAAVLAIALPFTLMRFLHGRTILRGLWLPALGGIAVYLMIVADARASVFAALLELVALIVLGLADKTRRSRLQRWLKLGVILAVFALPNVATTLSGRGTIPSQIQATAEQVARDGNSISIRWNLVRNGVVFVGETYGLGVGAGNAEWWMEHRTHFDTSEIYSLHNWWLELLVSYGILITTGFALFYIGIFRGVWQAWRTVHTPEGRALYGGLVVSMIGSVLASLGPSSIIGIKPFGLLLACGWAAVSIRRRAGEAT